ncbi:MAG: adenylate kinase [Spirochaetales bacterium]|nr:adenylate kinase [Spirochaetales bacterium]
MNLILLGPPGAGKGTMASGIKDHYRIPHISTGDIFRTAIKEGTELGKKVKSILDAGELVSDDLTVALVEERLSQPDAKEGYILDGFPRTIPQAEAFDKIAGEYRVLNFILAHDIVVNRLSGRRICKNCGEIFHIKSKPSQKEGVCDSCGGELYTRPDDMKEAILNRLEVYDAQTAPLVDFFQAKSQMADIDCNQPIPAMMEDVLKVLG